MLLTQGLGQEAFKSWGVFSEWSPYQTTCWFILALASVLTGTVEFCYRVWRPVSGRRGQNKVVHMW